MLEICNARGSPRQFIPRGAQFSPPPRRSPFAWLARASKTRTPKCVVQFAAGRVYDNVGQLGERGLLLESRIMPWQKQVGHPRQPQQMQGESADNLRETMNSPSSSRTYTETGHSLFF